MVAVIAAVGVAVLLVLGALILLFVPGQAATGLCVAGASATGLDAEGQADAAAITTTIAKSGLSPQDTYEADVVAIAASLQETGGTLHNLDHGDRDSVGIFQQRPSQGWGTPEQLMNPVYATQQFLTHLKAASGWQSMPVGRAAQAVQRSADSSGATYQARVPRARAIVGALAGAPCTATPSTGQAGGPASLACPVPHPTLTQPYGPTTVQGEPVIGGTPFHTGMDLAVPAGTPITAAASGVVTYAGGELDGAGQLVGYGNYVTIADGLGRIELYGHMEQILAMTGQTVQAGQEIGLVGSSGFSSGPHTHFEVRVNGQAVNPAPDLMCQF